MSFSINERNNECYRLPPIKIHHTSYLDAGIIVIKDQTLAVFIFTTLRSTIYIYYDKYGQSIARMSYNISIYVLLFQLGCRIIKRPSGRMFLFAKSIKFAWNSLYACCCQINLCTLVQISRFELSVHKGMLYFES